MADCISLLDIEGIENTIRDILKKKGINLKDKRDDIKFKIMVDINNNPEEIKNVLEGLSEGTSNHTLEKLFDEVSKSETVSHSTRSLTSNTSKRFKDTLASFLKAFSDDKNSEFKSPIKGINFSLGSALTALNVIVTDLTSQPDLIKKQEISDKDTIETLLKSVPLSRLYKVIGRAVLSSHGYQVAEGVAKNTAAYVEIGKYMVDKLAEAGIVTINEFGTEILNNLVDEDGATIKGTKKVVKKSKIGTEKVREGTLTVSLVEDYDGKFSSEEFNALFKLLIPSDIKKPLSNKDGKVDTTMDWSKSKETNALIPQSELKDLISDIYSNIQSRGFTLNKDLIELLKEVKTVFSEQSDKNFNKAFISVFGKDSKLIEDIFGLNLHKSDINMIELQSALGQELSKISPLKDLVENLDNYSESEIFSSLFLARNGRTHTYDSFLNYQGDKFTARWIMESAVESEYSDDVKVALKTRDTEGKISTYEMSEKEFLISNVAITLGVPVAVITGKLKDKNFEMLYSNFVNDKVDNTTRITNTYKVLVKAGLLKGNFWKQYVTLQAVKDIRNNKEGPLKTRFSVEADSSASGAQIKTLLSLGFKDTTKVVKGLLDGSTKDMYSPGQTRLNELLTQDVTDNISGSETQQTLSVIMEALYGKDYITNLDSNTRELLKYAIMTYLYGQTATNNAKQAATALLEELLPKDKTVSLVEIKKMVTSLGEVNQGNEKLSEYIKSFKNLTEDVLTFTDVDFFNKTGYSELAPTMAQVKELLEMILAETVGSILVEKVLQPVYSQSMYKEYDSQVEELYKRLSDVSKGDMSKVIIPSPLSVLSDTLKLEVKDIPMLALSKLKETLTSAGKTEVIDVREHLNPISAKVVPIHAIDGTVLLRSVYKFLAEKNGGKVPRTVSAETAIKLVHDAIIASPKDIVRLSELYEESMIAVTYKYDPRMALITAIESQGGEIPSSLKEKVVASVELKQETLIDLFGSDIENTKGIPLSFMTDYRKELDKVNASYKVESIVEKGTVETSSATTEELSAIINNETTTTTLQDLSGLSFEEQIGMIEAIDEFTKNNCAGR